jgi:prepilin-type processing-associated H-X9-DG protein
MKKSLLNPSATTHRKTGNNGAFTLTELFVVIGVVILLGSALLSASFSSQEAVFRAECASNLRQIGTAVNLYSGEANGWLPQFYLPNGSGINMWQTELLARNTPGTSTIIVGPVGLGILWTTKIVTDPKVYYCPSLGHRGPDANNAFAYNYYTWNGGPWPTDPPGDDKVRSAYNYYPQQKILENVQGYQLPVLSWNCAGYQNNRNSVVFVSPNPGDPPQSGVQLPCPFKLTDTDPTKAMAVDILMLLSQTAHLNNGQPAGVNALFPDGHVKFQTVRDNQGVNQAFNPTIWSGHVGPISTGDTPLGNLGPPALAWRRVMYYFQP